jgi:hypothetical protein
LPTNEMDEKIHKTFKYFLKIVLWKRKLIVNLKQVALNNNVNSS